MKFINAKGVAPVCPVCNHIMYEVGGYPPNKAEYTFTCINSQSPDQASCSKKYKYVVPTIEMTEVK